MLAEIQNEVEKIAGPLVAEAGLELIEVSVLNRQGIISIEIFADRPLGGISLDECADINKRISSALDVTQSWADNYELSVASPGLDRPLKTENDFRRVLNQKVRILLTEKIEGKGEYQGLVKKAGPGSVLVAIDGKNNIEVGYEKILKAVLNF